MVAALSRAKDPSSLAKRMREAARPERPRAAGESADELRQKLDFLAGQYGWKKTTKHDRQH